MAFSLFGKKKYPFNKQKKDPAAAVYAGPEYFARRSGRIYAGPEHFRGGEGEVLDVYAGPEFDEDPTPPEEIRRTFEGDAPLPPADEEAYNTVYAGPEKPEVAAPVYAGRKNRRHGRRWSMPDRSSSQGSGPSCGRMRFPPPSGSMPGRSRRGTAGWG